MRALALALLLALPLVGCLGADEPEPGLAKPTDSPLFPPVPTAPTPGRATFNATDPGYDVTTPWRVGDGWDWQSNGTPQEYRTLRVVEERREGNRTLVRVDETVGRVGQRAAARATQWVDASAWTLINVTDATGATTRFDPPKPLRFYRNASFAYNETAVDPVTRETLRAQWTVYSFVEPRWETLRLPWGEVQAFRVVHDAFAGGNRTARLTQWASPEHASPVRYAEGDVGWTLVAAVEGERRVGVLQPT